MCFETRNENVVLKDNEYDSDQPYVSCSLKNQSYVLFSTIVATWVSFGKTLGVS